MLLIDAQNAFLHPDGMSARWSGGVLSETSAAMVEPAKLLIREARAAGIPVIYTKHEWKSDFTDLGFCIDEMYADDAEGLAYMKTIVEGSWEVEIYDALAPSFADYIVTKNRYDAFIGTRLESLLAELGVTTLIVGGLVTSGCVEGTVRHGAMSDYRMFLVADAVGDIDTNEHNTALARLGSWFAHLVTTTDLAEAWASSTISGALPVSADS